MGLWSDKNTSDSVSELGTRPANDQTWVGKHDDINVRRLCKENNIKENIESIWLVERCFFQDCYKWDTMNSPS